MSSAHVIPEPDATADYLTEFEALIAAGPTVLDAIPGAVYLVDQDGRLVSYNREAAGLWGRIPELFTERFCGSHRLFLSDGTALAHELCPMAEATRTGSSVRNAEVVIERPDGSRITALVNIRALKDRQGRVQGAINCFQDVTALRQMEEEVRRKGADLEDFFENSAIGLHIVDGQGVIVRANKAELDLLGYAPHEYIGRHVAEVHADASTIQDILDRLSAGQALDRYPARLRAKDGSIKHVLITSNSRFESGAFVNTRCFTLDVTDWREAETARHESEERLAATYDAATIGIAEADASGRLLRVNDALCSLVGLSRDELLAMTFHDYTHKDDREADASLYAQQVRGQIPSYRIRKRCRRSDGSIRYVDVFSSSVRDAQGCFRYGVRVLQDVTDAKRMEDRIRENERQLRDLLEALPAAVYTTDEHGRIHLLQQDGGGARRTRSRDRRSMVRVMATLQCRRDAVAARSVSDGDRHKGGQAGARRRSGRRTARRHARALPAVPDSASRQRGQAHWRHQHDDRHQRTQTR